MQQRPSLALLRDSVSFGLVFKVELISLTTDELLSILINRQIVTQSSSEPEPSVDCLN